MIKIDWKVIWAQMEYLGFDIDYETSRKIKSLVEKQLKGNNIESAKASPHRKGSNG